jgi:uncharacterized protein
VIRSIIAICLVGISLPAPAADAGKAEDIVRAARDQIGQTLRYDPAYRILAYPNGDAPMEVGVCTDVVVRALRASLGMDLQRLVHADMEANFSSYPKIWKLSGPDKNIDHRRVPNLQTYFQRMRYEVPVSKDQRDYRAGDFVTCIVPPDLPHIMIVSDRLNAVGRPLVIHNIGAGTQEEDRLFEFKITGHYRIKKTEPSAAANSDAGRGVNR